MSNIKAPFPWFGGKSRVAAEVWARFGDVPNYVEPFAGSLAVLLGRPSIHRGKIETVNDIDGFIANFWRAVASDPEGVAHNADWPVNENDVHARHIWLVNQRAHLEARLNGDPDFYDAKIAGWWAWGANAYIGSGWCSGDGPWRVVDGLLHLGDAGQGINKKIPHLGDAGQGARHAFILGWFEQLSKRLRDVRVASGDWSRVVTESVTTRHGMTGLLLDPPYGDEVEQTRVYATDDSDVSAQVRQWCIENGNNRLLRIALCGYQGEGHDALLDYGWTSHAWRAAGGYGAGRGGNGEANRHKERIYFSPACLAGDEGLFDMGGTA